MKIDDLDDLKIEELTLFAQRLALQFPEWKFVAIPARLSHRTVFELHVSPRGKKAVADIDCLTLRDNLKEFIRSVWTDEIWSTGMPNIRVWQLAFIGVL